MGDDGVKVASGVFGLLTSQMYESTHRFPLVYLGSWNWRSEYLVEGVKVRITQRNCGRRAGEAEREKWGKN